MRADAPALTEPAPAPIAHTGRVGELLAISLVNLLLKVLTLGLYHFWAKTRVRRYVWSHTLYAGEAFEYTGRAVQLLVGYGLAMAVLIPVVLGLQTLPAWLPREPLLLALASAAVYPVFAFLTGFATFSSRRFMLSHTRWRSVRFALSGRARDHGLRLLLYLLLTGLSFGLLFPLMRNRLTAHLVGNAWFGSERFRYDGRDGALLWCFLLAAGAMLAIGVLWSLVLAGIIPIALHFVRGAELPPEVLLLLAVAIGASALLVLPALVATWLWYRAMELRHFIAHTSLATVRFELALPSWRYVLLHLSNVAGLVLTLGLAYPWVVVRTARTLADALRMHGNLDVAAIEQSAAAAPRAGEGLADALDLGSI